MKNRPKNVKIVTKVYHDFEYDSADPDEKTDEKTAESV